MTQGICILGSTGSIGCSTLDVISRNADKYRVEVLTAHTNVDKLYQQCLDFQPKLAILKDDFLAQALKRKLDGHGLNIQVQSGAEALKNAPQFVGVSTVVAAIVGAAGLLPTLSAVKCGHKVLLANKEALVMSGNLFMQAVRESGAVLLPVDSEHNAIFQCLPEPQTNAQPSLDGVLKILLTGSGGPFRQLPLAQLSDVTPEQACAHPNWDMGKKISVDSATMMNKGLELIEACFLFDIDLSQIEIVVHPQSIIHSMVSYRDGSVLAQMGNPDMRTPIAHTLAWPERIECGVEPLDFYQIANLAFEAPDYERFPCLALAAEAMKKGGTAPCILNAANEIAVSAFLAREIAFTDIAKVIKQTMLSMEVLPAETVEVVLQADTQAREIAEALVKSKELTS